MRGSTPTSSHVSLFARWHCAKRAFVFLALPPKIGKRMIYTHMNSGRKAVVFDVTAGQKLNYVVSVDTGAAIVMCDASPFEIDPLGNPVRIELRFDAIHAISGGGQRPVLFHCYRHSPSLVQH